jgi:hypothetical protein
MAGYAAFRVARFLLRNLKIAPIAGDLPGHE